MEASFFSKPLSQSECRIKVTLQLLSESECRNLGYDLTQKTQTNKMAEARHNADKHYLLMYLFIGKVSTSSVSNDKVHTKIQNSSQLFYMFYLWHLMFVCDYMIRMARNDTFRCSPIDATYRIDYRQRCITDMNSQPTCISNLGA